MPNRAVVVLNSIRECCRNETVQKAEQVMNLNENMTTAQQARAIRSALELLRHEGCDTTRLMRRCNCVPRTVKNIARDYYRKSGGNLSEFARMLTEANIGGQMYVRDDVIFAEYSRCLCGMPKAVRNMPESYCECSAGWFDNLFSYATERDVTVEVENSILAGGEKCVFRITLGKLIQDEPEKQKAESLG